MSLHRKGVQERSQDALYSMMTACSSHTLHRLASGIMRMVQERSTHPGVSAVKQRVSDVLVQRAVVFAALGQEADFLQHVLDMENVSSSAVSEFAVNVLPPILDKFLSGKSTLPEFVLDASHAYVSL